MSAIRAILFDIGNVLVRFDFSRAVRAVAAQSNVTNEREVLERIDAVKIRYEDGQMSRGDFLAATFELLGYRGSEADFIRAWQEIFDPNQPMLDLVERLAPRFPLYLLSNTNDMHMEYIHRVYPAFARFSGGTYSYAVSASKPHPRIYEIACAAHGLEPATTFFIDDLAANIATARQLGFQAHQYHPDHHEELLPALAAAGVGV